jgi:multiple sugar transport system substrate-binding protein
MSDQLGSAVGGKITFEQAMHNLQNNVVNYAKSQGFTVTS